MNHSPADSMVEEQLISRGIKDPVLLRAMRSVPREEFVGMDLLEFAYEDTPLPIEEGQTISQPFMVAVMIEALNLDSEDRVLEIGTGSGYAAAVTSQIAWEVYTVERIASLAHLSSKRLSNLGYDNIHVLHGDGSLGWPEEAPFDAIMVAAGGPEVPQALLEQLKTRGRLVIFIDHLPQEQTLLRIDRISDTKFKRKDLGQYNFSH